MKYLILAIFFSNIAHAKLVIDLSKHTISIGRNFKGTTVTAFGVCDKDEDIIILLQGGKSETRVKKLQKKHHIWGVDAMIKFTEVPDIYTLYSNKKIRNILPESDISALNLSISELAIKENLNNKRDMFYLYEAFQALIEQRKKYRLLGEYSYLIEKVDNSDLFRIKIEIPDRIKTGTYDVVAYSIKNEKITSVVAIPINIRKVGLNGILYHLANNYSKTYAISSVIWAMFLGWLVNYIIQAIRDKYRKDTINYNTNG